MVSYSSAKVEINGTVVFLTATTIWTSFDVINHSPIILKFHSALLKYLNNIGYIFSFDYNRLKQLTE